MPSYAGIDLGFVIAPSDGPVPAEWQRNAYPGVAGVEQLAMGPRGWTFQLQGFLFASNITAFVALKNSLYAYQVGQTANVYVDADGTSHSGTVLINFRPTGPRYFLDNVGPGVGQEYTAEFFYPGA